MSDAPTATAALAEWTALLDRFERDANASADDGTAASGAEPWTTPSSPLPPELADRARAVLDRQRDAETTLRAALRDAREQLDALRRVPAPRGDAPAFLDVTG